MFVHYFTHIPRSRVAVERAILAAPRSWLVAAVQGAYENGDGIRTRVGIGRNLRLTKEVTVHVGEPLSGPDRTTLPLRVEATGPTGLFPRLDADLEIASLGANVTQLTMEGSYRPPLGAAGAVLDRALLHRVVEAVVRHFVEHVSAMLAEQIPAAEPSTSIQAPPTAHRTRLTRESPLDRDLTRCGDP